MSEKPTYHVLTLAQTAYLRMQIKAKVGLGMDVELVHIQEDMYVLRLGPGVQMRIPWTLTVRDQIGSMYITAQQQVRGCPETP